MVVVVVVVVVVEAPYVPYDRHWSFAVWCVTLAGLSKSNTDQQETNNTEQQ